MNANNGALNKIRDERFEAQYKALESDADRLNWLVDMAMLETTAANIMSEQQKSYIDALLRDFFNPKKGFGVPDTDQFANRMNLYHNAKIKLRVDAGLEAKSEVVSGYFAESEEKSYHAAIGGDLKFRMAALDFFLVRAHIEDVYKDSYCQQVSSGQPPEAGKGAGKGDQFKTAMNRGLEQCEEEYLENCPDAKKQAYQYWQEMDKKYGERELKKVFSKEEREILDGYWGSISDQETERMLSETVYDLQSETKDAIAQFNTKRSWIFFGRESKEHSDLRRAAEDFQSKLQAYKDAEKKQLSPSQRLKAVRALEKASIKLEEMAGSYELKKGIVKTTSGDVRLQGALNLKQLGKETMTRMDKVARRLQTVVDYEAKKDKTVDNKEQSKDGRKKINVDEVANKYNMNAGEKKSGQNHKDKGRENGKQQVMEEVEMEAGN